MGVKREFLPNWHKSDVLLGPSLQTPIPSERRKGGASTCAQNKNASHERRQRQHAPRAYSACLRVLAARRAAAYRA